MNGIHITKPYPINFVAITIKYTAFDELILWYRPSVDYGNFYDD